MYSGYRQDGELWRCRVCCVQWVWVEDEAEGGSWRKAHMPRKRYGHDQTTYELVGGQIIYNVHDPSRCAGNACCVHSPTDHHMREWPQNYRSDLMQMERICEHGVGHPDPDDGRIFSIGVDDGAGVHGCDGCCTPPTVIQYEAAKLEVQKLLEELDGGR